VYRYLEGVLSEKYIERMRILKAARRNDTGLNMGFLAEHGFL
jgi:hypothetical protein